MLAFVVLAVGCGKADKSEPAKTEPKPADKPAVKPADKPKDAPPPAPTGPQDVTVEVSMPASGSAKIKMKMPGGFAATNFGASMKNQAGEAESAISFSITCDGECTPAKLPGALAKLVDGAPERAKQPNFNTGDAKLDAVRLDVETVDKGDIPDGKFVTYRVKKPAGLEGPYREQFEGACARLDKTGKQRFVIASVYAPLGKEKELGPALVEACKTFEILP